MPWYAVDLTNLVGLVDWRVKVITSNCAQGAKLQHWQLILVACVSKSHLEYLEFRKIMRDLWSAWNWRLWFLAIACKCTLSQDTSEEFQILSSSPLMSARKPITLHKPKRQYTAPGGYSFSRPCCAQALRDICPHRWRPRWDTPPRLSAARCSTSALPCRKPSSGLRVAQSRRRGCAGNRSPWFFGDVFFSSITSMALVYDVLRAPLNHALFVWSSVLLQCSLQDLNRGLHKGPTFHAQFRARATGANVIVVIHVDIKDQLAFQGFVCLRPWPNRLKRWRVSQSESLLASLANGFKKWFMIDNRQWLLHT